MSATETVTLWIDGIKTQAEPGSTVMAAADAIGIRIPRLCYHPDLSRLGACRVCLVEVEGMRNPVASCAYPVVEDMKVKTHTSLLRRLRRDIVELILDNHPKDCQTCERDGSCELQRLAYETGIRERLYEGERKQIPKDSSSPAVMTDPEKCILCGRCVRVCSEVQGVHNLSQHGRGFTIDITPAHGGDMLNSVCVQCGQCANVCPTAAIVEQNHTDEVFRALEDPNMHVIVQAAPSIRAALGEGFGYEPGTPVTGKMVTALRHMGFDKVFDTNFGADLTIIEEAHEFLSRLESGKKLPLITSCSPGWVKFMEHFYPDMIPLASSCRSPMSMLSVLLKTYYAEKMNLNPEQIYSVGVMPCTAKKYEAQRPEHRDASGVQYTDAVVTTREIIWMMKCFGVNFTELPDGEFDMPLGMSSGAGDIFGTTGGVMEAALRTACEKVTGRECECIDFKQVRGVEGVKEAELDLDGTKLRVGVANGLNNARILLDKARANPGYFHMIEIMACPGGCIGGGGQPYPPAGVDILDKNLLRQRAKALYTIDSEKKLRKSHDNPFIQKLYDEYLGEPNGKKSHELLHTNYKSKLPRGVL